MTLNLTLASMLGAAGLWALTRQTEPPSADPWDRILIFPGSTPVYKGPAVLVGGLGVSGDGVAQDDVVTFRAAAGYAPPSAVLRADQVRFAGVRLPFIEFDRNPEA